MRVCGFVILRKPIFNYDEGGRGAFSSRAPHIGDMYYAGIDRMPWFELHEDYYKGTLPNELISLRQELLHSSRDFSDFKLIQDVSKAIQLLEYSNKDKQINELTAVFSDIMEKSKGTIDYVIDIDWIGVDIYCHGYGSLIREGIFANPCLFSEYLGNLNRDGLFDLDSGRIDSYVHTYIELAPANNLEPIDEAKEYLDRIVLGRMQV
jgi:hypothetical protein